MNSTLNGDAKTQQDLATALASQGHRFLYRSTPSEIRRPGVWANQYIYIHIYIYIYTYITLRPSRRRRIVRGEVSNSGMVICAGVESAIFCLKVCGGNTLRPQWLLTYLFTMSFQLRQTIRKTRVSTFAMFDAMNTPFIFL